MKNFGPSLGIIIKREYFIQVMRKQKQSLKVATRDEQIRPAIKLAAIPETVELKEVARKAAAAPPAPRAQTKLFDDDVTLKPRQSPMDEIRLFESVVPKDTKTSEAAAAISALKIVPEIHLEPGSIDRKIDVTPDDFPLNRYDPLRKVFESDGGSVHIANDLLTGTTVLIRTSKHSLDAEEQEKFAAQIATSKSFSHNDVLPVIQHGITSGGKAFVTCEYIAGVTLKKYIEDSAPVDEVIIVNIFTEICSLVCTAHEQGVLLNNLDLDEIILTSTIFGNTAVKISPFGIETRRTDTNEIEAEATPEKNEDQFLINEILQGDVAAIAKCLRSAFEANQKIKKKGIGGLLSNEPAEPLDPEVESILWRTGPTPSADRIDTVLKLKHELQGLRELLTYSKPRSVAKKTEAYDKKTALTFSSAVVPSLILIGAALWLTVKPLELAQMKDNFLDKDSMMAETMALPILATQTDDDYYSPDGISLGDGSVSAFTEDVSRSGINNVLRDFKDKSRKAATGQEINNPVVNQTDDVFARVQGEEPRQTYYGYNSYYRSEDDIGRVSEVTFKGVKLDAELLAPLKQERNIGSLTFINCYGITSEVLESLAKSDLAPYRVTFKRTNVTGDGIKRLLRNSGYMPRLEITDSKFNDRDLEAISELPIRSLTLKNTAVTNSGLEKYTNKNLYSLTVGGKSLTLSESMLQEHFPNVHVNTIEGSPLEDYEL